MAVSLAWRRVALFLAVISVGAFQAGCATYSDSFGLIEQNLAARQYDAALQEIEKQANSKTDRALYLLNKGMVQRMAGDFAGSNQTLEKAKSEMERLYAASVSENALSFLINDATVSYAGDDYEQVLVHLFMALNYLELGQPLDARVEALQVDIKLREIGEKIPENKFTEDALSRYITGMIYEELGEWSDAMIAYRKAYGAYKKYRENYGVPVPDMLKHDLLRLTQRQGLNDELEQYRKEFGIEPQAETDDIAGEEGELVFILNNGLAPIKREKIVSAAAPQASVVVDSREHRKHEVTPMPYMVSIALPYYESRPKGIASARISLLGKQTTTQMMEDIDAIARASLDSRMTAITARSVARMVAKIKIQDVVDRTGRNKDSELAAELLGSFLVRVATMVTERADTRSWLTLPANVQMAKLSVPPGSYTVTVELMSEGGQAIATREYPEIVIKKKRKTYLTQHWVPDMGASLTRRRWK